MQQLRNVPLALAALLGCGGGGSGQTCYSIQLTYRGAHSGPSYLKLVAVDDPTGFNESLMTHSIQELLAAFNSSRVCYGGHGKPSMAVSAVAWIDVTGNDGLACANVLNTQCQPSAADPQGRQSATIYSQQVNVIKLEIVDPP